MTVKTGPAEQALSRLVRVDAIPEEGLSMSVEASPAERDALRVGNGLVALETLRAQFTIRREGRHGLRVSGEVAGSVVQTCVVSLDAFEAEVREPVSVHFLQPEALERWRAEREAEPAEAREAEQVDEPDAIEDDQIDLGALAAEYLTLGLDPHPRKPGVRFEEIAPAAMDDASPFAVLKALRSDSA